MVVTKEMNSKEQRLTPRASKSRVFSNILTTVLLAAAAPALAQGSPVPGMGGGIGTNGAGASNPYVGYGNQPGQPGSQGLGSSTSASAPVPGAGRGQPTAGAPGAKAPGSKYRDLPLTVDSTKYRLDELRALLSVSRPQDMQDSVQELCEWLNDAADAHYRMYLSFAKSDLTKTQANSEKQLNQRFGQLKREAQLLRADLLIKQLRAPEALAPLVDIVVADPRSATGKEAYKRLVDLGFSQAVSAPPEAGATAGGGAQAQHDTNAQASSQPLRPLH